MPKVVPPGKWNANFSYLLPLLGSAGPLSAIAERQEQNEKLVSPGRANPQSKIVASKVDSLDHSIRSGQHVGWNREADLLGGFKIDR